MAFMGETTEVGVAELLSVLARRGHTGRLTISADRDDTQIYLDAGAIALVSSTGRDLRLGRMLIRLGALDEAQLGSAVREQDQAGNGRALGQILVESGRVSVGDLAHAAEEQCIEALARVIVAPHGSFMFNRDLRPAVRRGLLRLNAEGIVLEASRRADEMKRLRGQLPPPGARLGLIPNAHAQTSPLGGVEARVVDVLRRAPHSLGELSDDLPIEEVALWRAIVGLRKRGMIYAIAEAPVDEDPPAAQVSPRPQRSIPELLQLGAAGPNGSTKPVPTLDEIRAAQYADEETATALRELLLAMLEDRNQGCALDELSHYSDDYFRRRGMLETAAIEALRRSGSPLPLTEQETLSAIRDVRLLADGRASAIVITHRAGAPETRAIMIFASSAGAWRIDADLG
jgi:hypothetical protein